ncbi:MAG: 4-alpha-glucanotransferase [Rhizobiaceae bacterium]|nr:4-alpha-glucanotransferase [Rhizobiaceae bacterium]
MTSEQALDWLADYFGIVGCYRDLTGEEQATSKETKLALLWANEVNLTTDIEIRQAASHYQEKTRKRRYPEEIVIDPKQRHTLPTSDDTTWHIQTEQSPSDHIAGCSKGQIDIPPLQSGIHNLHIGEGKNAEAVRLIVAPKTAPSLIEVAGQQHLWGVNAALYGLHSKSSPGIGNFQHLSKAAEICGQHGASFLGINPVHAIGWSSPEVISPYSPSHRGFLNGFYIAADIIEPCSNASQKLIADWKSSSLQKSTVGRVDYCDHVAHLRPLLIALYKDFVAQAPGWQKARFHEFCRRGGTSLVRFARFEKTANRHGSESSSWPQHTNSSSVESIFGDPDLQFHAWVQWIADGQLESAHAAGLASGMKLGLYLDFAVGARRDGAEAWCEAASIAQGVSIGAPPDHLSPAGQNWNLTAFAPKKLAANNYQAFRDILSQAMRHCGVIRIDHVLGLNRCYWIPDDGSPGGYIRQNFQAMMALVRLEAQRSNTLVIGEDLGLVPTGFRETMNERNIYSYGVLQYEKNAKGKFRSPKKYRSKSLVCFGTHDTPTLAGYFKARDIDWWQKLNWINDSNTNNARAVRRKDISQLFRLSIKQKVTARQSFNLLRNTVHDALAGSNAAMVSVQLDDVFGSVEAQNLPGTIDEHPNWQTKYPCPTEELKAEPQLVKIGQIMASHTRSNSQLAKRKSVK